MRTLPSLLLRGLAFWTLVAPIGALHFKFPDVEQCGPVTISFAGPSLPAGADPTSLLIIPINSTAISIPLTGSSLISTGIALSFLPLVAGSDFLASLDNSTGNLISTSHIIQVLPSATGNSSCLPTEKKHTRRYSISPGISQCENMTITYDKSVVSTAPTVRLFNPSGSSFLLNMTSDDPAHGVATYLMGATRGTEIVLLIDDKNGTQETSPVILVGGDASSDSSCLKSRTSESSTRMTEAGQPPLPSTAIIIGCATGGTVVFVIAVGMGVFVVRERRRRRAAGTWRFDPSRMEKEKPSDDENPNFQDRFPPQANSLGIVANPIYTSNGFASPTRSIYPRNSLSSWAQAIPEDQRKFPVSPTSPSHIMIESPRPNDRERLSIQSLDIEGMLNMATLQSENPAGRKNSQVTISPSLVVPSRTLFTSDRHRRNPSDVPAGFDSVAYSRYSENPFDGHASITPSILQSSLHISRPSESDGGRISGTTSRSSFDGYGIAR